MTIYEYTIRWKYGEFEGIRIVRADDDEMALHKMWVAIESDYRPKNHYKHQNNKKNRILKKEKVFEL